MEAITEIMYIITAIKNKSITCGIFDKSQIYWTGSLVKENLHFIAVLDIHKINEIRIRIDENRYYLNGLSSNVDAVFDAVNELNNCLTLLEEMK